jgi:beta-glucosidase
VGALAKYPRYQGAGSSHINPYKVTSLLESLEKEALKMQYFEGYSLGSDEILDETEELLQTLKKDDVVIIAAGLPDSYESEGFDRKHMRLPENQNALIRSIGAKSDHVVVVLFGGSPVELPWLDNISSLLHAYLPGQAGGKAVTDLLL